MYWTPEGARILKGAEATVFAEALGMMVDFLTDGDTDFRVFVIDRLQRGQKLVVMEQLAVSLLDESTPAPQLTAVLEGAVAAVFYWIEDRVVQECELEDHETRGYFCDGYPSWRQRVLDACREWEMDTGRLDAESNDLNEWSLVIVSLADRVLWDDDFAMDDHLDLDPDRSQRVKEFMGINDDYFLAVPADPPDHEILLIIARIKKWTHKSL